jgi:excisionase family DNA binding protein
MSTSFTIARLDETASSIQGPNAGAKAARASNLSVVTGSLPGISYSERPITVKEAANFLGVSTQTVYLWVERRQIPHLRVMGRNIRFLKSDLEPFRATFKQEVENGTAD